MYPELFTNVLTFPFTPEGLVYHGFGRATRSALRTTTKTIPTTTTRTVPTTSIKKSIGQTSNQPFRRSPRIAEKRKFAGTEQVGSGAKRFAPRSLDQLGTRDRLGKKGTLKIISRPLAEPGVCKKLENVVKKIEILENKKVYQLGDHFNNHGRRMGYESKKAYDIAAKEFAKKHLNNPSAEVVFGTTNPRSDLLEGIPQMALSFNGKSVVINKGTGKIVDFYLGNEHRALIKQVRIR